MELREHKKEIQNHSVKIISWKLSETGKITGDKYIRTIGPQADISAESEDIQAICNAARIGYVAPVIEEPVEEEPVEETVE